MTKATLIIVSPDEPARKVEIFREVSIGRAPDNFISIDDRRVSQYHAVIERIGDEFYVSDLGSTNGTTVNGESGARDHKLSHGDVISIASAAALEFYTEDGSSRNDGGSSEAPGAEIFSASSVDHLRDTQAPQAHSSRRASRGLIVAGVAAAVLVGGGVLLAASLMNRSDAAVRILSPESGSTIRAPQTIRIEADETRNIEQVIYMLDGTEFAVAEHPPFEAALDPAQLQARLRNLATGNHVLTVTVEDKDGNKRPQPETVLVAFELSGEKPDSGDLGKRGDEDRKELITVSPPQGGFDVVALSRNLAATISGKSWYDFDAEFAEEIHSRINGYRVNVVDDASRYRRQIGSAFNGKGLPPAIGYVIASSESRFRESGSSDQKIGFWQVPRQIAIEQGYIAKDESPSALKDVKRSAEVAASYINDLVNAVGGMDHFMYAAACYGKPLKEAAKMRARLEEIDPNVTDRKDFGRMVRMGVVPRDGAERVASFFAAGIVGENPQAFGLNCRPLSSLY